MPSPPGPKPHPWRRSPPRLPLAEALERRLCLTTWYVSPYGSDIAPGSVDAPLASIGAAAGRARAGDVVLVRAGTYSPGTSQVLGSIGAADGRITFQAYPGEMPVIDGSSLAAATPVVEITGQYIDFNDIEIRNAKGVGIAATGQHLQVLNDTIDGAARQGILVGSGGSPDATNDVFVQGNYVYNDDLAAKSAAAAAPPVGSRLGVPPVAGLEAYGASGVSFNGNFVHDNYGIGIELVLADTASASGNLVHDNFGVNVALDNATHVTVNQNFIYNTGETAFFTNGAPAVSIRLSNGSYGVSNSLDALLIENNICLSRSVNLLYANVSTPPGSDVGLKDSTIANNVFYSGGGPNSVNLQVDFSPGHQKDVVVDNIFYQTDGAQVLFGTSSAGGSGAAPGGTSGGISGGTGGASAGGVTSGGTAPAGFTFQYNNWFNGGGSTISQGGAASASGPGDIYFDPDLVNPGTIDPAAYKLQPGSPDVDAGVAVDGVVTDYYGVPRPQGKLPDIGAHELVTAPPPAAAVPAPPGVAPGVPTGLAATATPYEIDLTWGDYVTPLAGFDIQRRGNGDWIPLGYGSAGPGNSNFNVTGSFADTGLKPNHRYTYRVFAFFADNTVSGYSKSFSFKTAKKPKAPKPPKAVKTPKAVNAAKATKSGSPG